MEERAKELCAEKDENMVERFKRASRGGRNCLEIYSKNCLGFEPACVWTWEHHLGIVWLFGNTGLVSCCHHWQVCLSKCGLGYLGSPIPHIKIPGHWWVLMWEISFGLKSPNGWFSNPDQQPVESHKSTQSLKMGLNKHCPVEAPPQSSEQVSSSFFPGE